MIFDTIIYRLLKSQGFYNFKGTLTFDWGKILNENL